MVQRFLLATVAIVFIAVTILLVDGFIAESTGLSLPGELSAALAIFVAFLVGGRIGGTGYFWLGILLFLGIQVFSISIVFDTVRDIEATGGGASQVTWVSIAFESWPNFVLSLVASIMGLTVGARGMSAGERSPRNAA